MNVDLVKEANGLATLTLDISPADIEAATKKRAKELAATMSMKGFRPGKVPAQLVEKMYGGQVKSEAVNNLVTKGINSYLKDNNVNFLGELVPVEDNALLDDTTTELKLHYRMALVPEFTLPSLESITVPKYHVSFSDEEANQELEQLRKRHGKLHDAEAVTDESILSATLKREGVEDSKTYISMQRLTEQGRAAFFGKKLEDALTVNFSEAFGEEELRKVLYLVKEEDVTPSGEGIFTIEKIQEFTPAEIDHDFICHTLDLGHDTTVEQVPAVLKERMSQRFENDTDVMAQNELLSRLTKELNLTLPEEFLRGEITKVLTKNKQEVTEEATIRELQSIKNSLLVDKLAEVTNVEVDYEDVLSETVKAMGQAGYTRGLDDEYIRQMASKMLSEKDSNVMRDMYQRARVGKILSTALEQVKMEDTYVTFDELNALAKNQA